MADAGTSEIQKLRMDVLANNTGPGDIDNDTPGAYEFIPVQEATLRRVSFVCTTTIVDDTSPATILIYKRPTAGAATDQVQIGKFTLPSAMAAGQVAYMEVGAELPAQTTSAIDGSKLNDSPANVTDTKAVPGESFYFVVGNDSTSGAGSFAFEYEEHGFRDDDENVTKVASDIS
jgi:hypothetical protein